mgnify:CR=1 FL=1
MTTLSPSKQLELKLAQAYLTLRDCSGEHKVGCNCSTCQWVEEYEVENKLDDETLYEKVLNDREYFDDNAPVKRMDDDTMMDLQNDR